MWKRVRTKVWGLALALAALLVCLWAAPRPSAAQPSVVVIVNAGNPVQELPADEVARMFLKKMNRWSNGERVLPVDLSERSPVRDQFSNWVHGKGTSAIKAYWQKMIFAGREVPPPEKNSVNEVVEYVRSYAGAIGYAPAGADLGTGVKAVRVRQ